MRLLLILLFPIILLTEANASVSISCENSKYAGKTLDFFTYSNPISKEKVFSFSLEFDKNGSCSKSIDIQKNTYVFSNFGIYQGMLFIEPNQNINLKLPPLREKSFADQKNPYFESIPFWFNTEDKNQLSNAISDFTIKLNQLTNKYFDQLYFRHSKSIYDSIIITIENDFGKVKNETFQMHKKLSLKAIEIDAFRLKPESYSSLFSELESDFWLHPAFIDIFEKTFNDQLSFQARQISGIELQNAVNNSDINYLIKHVKTKYKITGEVVDLTLLKLLHDAYYSNEFSKNAIENIVISNQFSKNKNKIIRDASTQITTKFTHLKLGMDAPIICLNNWDEVKICSNQSNDKFKYLVFADTEMLVCQEHLKYIETIQQKFKQHLEIFIILRETNRTQMKKFFTDVKVPGNKMIDKEGEWINEYKIRSYPQCYLLDENHKIKFESTKAPLDGFEQQFGSFITRELFERQRNQSR